MATVAIPSVGHHRTIPMDAWLPKAKRLAMLATQIKGRFTVWHGVEQRVDVWASAGALALAVTSIVALTIVGPF